MEERLPGLPRQPRDRAGAAVDEAALSQAVLLAYPDAVLLVDDAGFIALANPAAAQLLGYSAAELRGLPVETLVPQASRMRHAEIRQAYAQTPRPRPMGTRMDLSALRKDGSEVVVEIALSPLHRQGLHYVLAAIRDISAYPRMQQVQQRARYSEQLAQLGRLAVDARDPQQVLERVAAVAADELHQDAAMVYLLEGSWVEFRLAGGVGLPPGDSPGMRVANRADTLPGLVLQHGRAVHSHSLGDEQRFVVPASYRTAGLNTALALPLSDRGRTIGALVVLARRASPLGEDEQRFLESMCNLLATSLQRAQSEDALQHAERLDSVGQLTGGIAHDFNNLLTIIQGNLQVLEELPSMADDAHGQQLVAAATRAARRGAELTGKLLAFSRRQVLQPSTLDIRQLLQSLADMLRRTLDQRIRIEVEVAPECPPVQADPGQLEAALLNIAINARDAMREGGSLRFAASACEALPAEVRDHLDDADLPHAGFVAITVADTGTGMPDAVKQRAFEPFFTTKEPGRGTGLGLSTVYGFVKQSKGAVAIDSAQDAGTTLTLYLPRPARGARALDDTAASHQAVPPGLKVLLVEDDTDVREVVRAFLEALQCQVTLAASGEQALLALGPDGRFDLLLSDIALGAGMRGTQLAAMAQQRVPGLAVLLMSGYSAALLSADRDAPAAWGLLRKPYTRDELASAMAQLLAAREAAR